MKVIGDFVQCFECDVVGVVVGMSRDKGFDCVCQYVEVVGCCWVGWQFYCQVWVQNCESWYDVWVNDVIFVFEVCVCDDVSVVCF